MVGVAAAGGIQAIREMAKRHGDKAVRMYFARAMFDPAYAQSLVKLTAQAKKPSAELIRQINAQVARTVMAVKTQSGGD
jgi:hypothetical protein